MTSVITRPKPFCFVLMPFDQNFSDIYEFGIKGACVDNDVYCERVDEQIFFGSMLDRIYNQISRADIIVADMTGRNPNVFYEVGYAHALGKKVVLLTQKADDIPFDLKHFPHVVYDCEIKKLRAELGRRVKHLAFSIEPTARNQFGIEIFLGKEPLANGDVERLIQNGSLPNATLCVFNGTSTTYAPGEFRVAVVAPPPYSFPMNDYVTTTELPDGNFLHMLPECETLFPGAYTTVYFALIAYAGVKEPELISVTLRVFSSEGYRDFPLRLRQANIL